MRIINVYNDAMDSANILRDAELDYLKKKHEFELKKADLLVNTDWEKETGKKKLTVGEKEAWISIQVQDKQKEVDAAKVNMDYQKRCFDIQFARYKSSFEKK